MSHFRRQLAAVLEPHREVLQALTEADRESLAWPCPACKKPAGKPCYLNGQTHTARQRKETT